MLGAQARPQPQGEQPVLVQEVGAEAEQERAAGDAGRRRRLGLGDDDAVVDAERHQPRPLVVDEVLAARVAQRVRRGEHHAVGERERRPG